MREIKDQKERIKVLYLPRWYPNRYDPMPGLFIERHGRAASAHVEVSVLYVHADSNLNHGKFDIVTRRDEQLCEVRIYYPSSKGITGKFISAWNFLKAHTIGFKEIKKIAGKPDIVHIHVLTRLGVLAWLYKLVSGTPYVITEHWTRYLPNARQFHGLLRKVMTRIVVRNASAVLPVTQNLADAMKSHGLRNGNYHVIPNVVDIRKFTPGNYTRGGRIKMIHVSCFEDQQKNISGLLNVLKRLAEIRQDWEMHMVGDGVHFEMLKEMAKRLGLHGLQGLHGTTSSPRVPRENGDLGGGQERGNGLQNEFVKFHGLKEGEDLVRLMQNADFQVLFSRFENLPVVILEGYACGLPILSTDVGGIRERVNEKSGKLVPSEDQEALLQEMIEMMDTLDKYDRGYIRKYAEETFSERVIGEQLYGVYRDIFFHHGFTQIHTD